MLIKDRWVIFLKKNYLEAGKIVGTHGVRGMVRIQHWCDSAEFFCNLKNLYLDDKGQNKISISSKPHGNVVIATIKGVTTIEDAEKYRNKIIYMNRKDAGLEEGQYYISDLIGLPVYNTKNIFLGKISDVSRTGANDVWHINNEGKEYLIPCIPDVIISVNIDNEIIVINPLKGIFADED